MRFLLGLTAACAICSPGFALNLKPVERYRQYHVEEIDPASSSLTVTIFGDPCRLSFETTFVPLSERLVVLVEQRVSIAAISCPPEYITETVNFAGKGATHAVLYAPEGARVEEGS